MGVVLGLTGAFFDCQRDDHDLARARALVREMMIAASV